MRPLAALLFALLLPLHALAAGLSGTWTLDKAASSDITPLLAAEGASAIERGLVARMSVTQVIDDTGDRIHLELQSALRNKSMDLVLDGVERTEPGDHGPTQATHVRGPDGVVTSTLRFEARVGAPAVLVIRREVQGDALRQQLTLTIEGQPPVQALRVFRRG